MLFNIDSNISSIKASRFPTLDSYKITFNTYGTDNVINIVFKLNKDESAKIENNQLSKFLKTKLFIINSNILENNFNNLSSNDNYLLLDEYIQKNNLLFLDINSSYEGITSKDGSRTYSKTFTIPELQLKYLTLGYYFYYDLNDYLSEYKLDLSYINKAIFWNNLNLISLAIDDKLSNNPSLIDIRKVKSLLNNKIIDNPTLSLDIEQTLNKKLKESKLFNTSYTKYFSNSYITKNQNNNLALIFNLNYKKLLTSNSIYDPIINKSIDDLFEIYSQINKITGISVLRKQKRLYKNKNGKTFKDIRNSEVVLCSSAVDNTNSIVTIDNPDVVFTEQNTNNSFGSDIKTYTLIDKKAFKNGGGVYDYGIKISINNNLNVLYKYLAEQHMSSGAKALEDFKNLLDNPSNYNPLDDLLSRDFIKSLGNDGSNTSLVAELKNALDSFFLVLNVFGLKETIDADLENSIVNIFDPQNLSVQNILYFIEVYQRLQHQLVSITKQIYDNTVTIEHWFNNPYEADKYINYGYKFFNFGSLEQRSSFPAIDSSIYVQKINSETIKYTNDDGVVDDSSDNTLYTFITPSNIVFSDNKTLTLDSLIQNQASISNLEYSEALIQIKKLSLKEGTIHNIVSNGNNNFKINTLLGKRKILTNKIGNIAEDISNELSIVTSNINNKTSNTNLFSNTNNLQNFTNNIKNNLDTSSLLLQIINSVSLDKKTFNFNNSNTTTNNNGVSGVIENNLSTLAYNLLPMHIKSLLSKKTNLFLESDQYLKNIELYSKYLILFNTIHSVQYLSYNSSTGEEEWVYLTKRLLDTEIDGKMLICKLTSYINSNYNLEGTKNLNLPVYDSYFMLKITSANTALPIITSFVRNKAATISGLVSNVSVNRNNIPFKTKQTEKNSKIEAAVDLLNKKIISSNIEASKKFNDNLNRFLKIKK